MHEKQRNDDVEVARLIDKGTQSVKLAYSDGGQHASFRNTAYAMAGEDVTSTALASPRQMAQLGDVSRPDALDLVHEIPVDERGQATGAPRRVQQGSGSSVFALAAAVSEPVTTAAVVKKSGEADRPATEKPVVMAAAKPSTVAPAPENKANGLTGGGLFSASLNDLTGLFKPNPASAAEPSPAGFYDKLINVIRPEAGLSDSKPDLPAKVPLPPRRQALASSTSIQ